MITHSFYVYVYMCFVFLVHNQKLHSKRTAKSEKKKKKNKDLKSQPKHMQMLQLTNKDFKITMICMLKKYKENSNID